MGQFSLTMQTKTITLLLLLAASFSNGGVVKRSIQDKPFKSGKELLQMKDASDAIKTSFKQASGELEGLAGKIENEVNELASLSSYINETETEKITDALAEALNIQNILNDQRRELSGLAKQTISKSDRIIRKFKETVDGTRTFEKGMNSMLRDMKNLLRFSETKLKEAKDLIDKLRERVNNVEATLRVFKKMIEGVKEREADLKKAATGKDVENILSVVGKTVVEGVAGGDGTENILKSVFNGVTSLAKAVTKILTREDIMPRITSAIRRVTSAIAKVTILKNAMEDEVALIIKWRDAVQVVKNDVFQGNLKDEDDQNLMEELKGIVDEGDVEEITEPFESLKQAATNYLNHVRSQCPSCAE